MKPFRILCSLDLSQVGILIGHAILTEQEIPGGRWRHQSRRQRQVLHYCEEVLARQVASSGMTGFLMILSNPARCASTC